MEASRSPARDARALAAIERLGNAGLESRALLGRLVQELRPVVPFDAFCATTTDPASNLITDAIAGRESAPGGRGESVTANYFARVYFEHDLDDTLAMLRAGQVVRRLADATGGDLARSGRFRLHLRPRHLGPEVYLTFVDRGLWGELHLTREMGSPDFSDREVDLLRRVSPRIGAGLRAAALTNRGAAVTERDASDTPGVLILDRTGRVVSTTANVSGFLGELGTGGGRARDAHDLPVAIQVVLAALHRSVAPVAEHDRHRVPRLTVRGASGRWLTLDASLTEPIGDRPSEWVVIIAPGAPEQVAWLAMTAYDLSPREDEVVHLVVQGLPTKAIAARLFISEFTVQRHLSNIFEKVGVRSRRDLVKRLFVEQVLPSLN